MTKNQRSFDSAVARQQSCRDRGGARADGVKRVAAKRIARRRSSSRHGIIKPVSWTNQGNRKASPMPASNAPRYQRPDSVKRRNIGMIEDLRRSIDYEASGSGPTMVLVPGSCSTGPLGGQ